MCDGYLQYLSSVRKCTVPATLPDFHECTARAANTQRAETAHIPPGLKCGVQLLRKEATPATEHVESVGQFNLIGFVDDLSLFAQTLGGAQTLLEEIQE